MKTNHIEQIIVDYIKKNETQYAILVNGVWGSGKTFFWKTRLIKLIKDSGFKTMYISLNGIASIEKLEQQIFLQFLPKLGKDQNEILNNLTSVSKNLANATSKFFFKSDLTDLIKGTSIKSFSFKNQCICFDDLERCKIPVDELFGYLSDFIEHKYLKCILLADEKKIEDQVVNKNLENGYDVIKEKIIGRVLIYDPEIELIVPNLIAKYKSDNELFKFLKAQENFIIEFFKEQNIKNLRIVNFYLDSLHTIFPYIEKGHSQFTIECLFLLAVISVEFKGGKLTSKDAYNYKEFNDIDANWHSRITSNFLRRKDKDTPRVKSETELFYEQYLMSRIDQYYFYQSLYDYILSGYFDSNVFMDELKKREPKELSKEIKAFRTLLHYKFRELDDAEFIKLSKEVLAYSKKGMYGIYDYKQIANFYFYFSEKGLIGESKDEIERTLLTGLKKSAKRKEINQMTYGSLNHFKNEQLDTQNILDTIVKLHKEIQAENDSQLSNKAIQYIESEKVTDIAQLFEDNKYKVEFLPLINSEEIVKAIIKSSNKMIFALSEIFKARYEYGNPGKFMVPDLEFLRDINSKLNLFLNTNTDIVLIRLHNFQNLISNLESSIEKIESTK